MAQKIIFFQSQSVTLFSVMSAIFSNHRLKKFEGAVKSCAIYFIFFSIVSTNASFAEDSSCIFFKFCRGNSASSRSSAQSMPSISSAASLNPSNISQARGLGVETIYQSRNSLRFDLVSGNGRIGALLSPSEENSFFGNRPIEMDSDYLNRRANDKQFRDKKINLALGLNLIGKDNMALDIGMSAKRNPDIKRINLGVGMAARIFIFTMGAYIYNDDVKVNLGNNAAVDSGVPYSTIYNSSTYQEKFQVEVLMGGMRLGNLALDVAAMKTKYVFYPDQTNVFIYSTSYSYKKFMFNYAQRVEGSSNLAYVNGALQVQKEKREIYYGIQYLLGKHFLIGVAYNNFLLHEVSGMLTIFI